NVDVASNWFNVVASIGEAVKPIVPPLLKRVFCAKRKVTQRAKRKVTFNACLSTKIKRDKIRAVLLEISCALAEGSFLICLGCQ
ncbi:MAG: hypothetical protein IJ774_04040, partial [Selenomonadaceae bacterium]|nr:hypothetical protein [Selenomonadaceae bacterium]